MPKVQVRAELRSRALRRLVLVLRVATEVVFQEMTQMLFGGSTAATEVAGRRDGVIDLTTGHKRGNILRIDNGVCNGCRSLPLVVDPHGWHGLETVSKHALDLGSNGVGGVFLFLKAIHGDD